jgi:hypothetical protein
MRESTVQALVCQQLGLRVGREMAEHLVRQAQQSAKGGTVAPITVIAADARTGVPVHTTLSPDALRVLLIPRAS